MRVNIRIRALSLPTGSIARLGGQIVGVSVLERTLSPGIGLPVAVFGNPYVVRFFLLLSAYNTQITYPNPVVTSRSFFGAAAPLLGARPA